MAANANATGAPSADALFSPAFATTTLALVAAGTADTDLEIQVGEINDLFPADVVAHCRPDYGLALLARANVESRALAESIRQAS